MRERERERGSCLLVVTAACGEERGYKRSLPLCSHRCNLLIIEYSTVCGLPWFFPLLWVFHVNILCLLSIPVLSLCIYRQFGCGRTKNRIESYQGEPTSCNPHKVRSQPQTESYQLQPNPMASTSGSLEMSLRRFDGSNFNFWKEQMQDYLIVKG